jgi:hypothetical protein
MNLRLVISTFTVLGLMLYTISLLPAGDQSPTAAPDPQPTQVEPGLPALAEPQLLIYRDPVLIRAPVEFYEMPIPPDAHYEPLIIEFDPESITPNLISESYIKPLTQEVQL